MRRPLGAIVTSGRARPAITRLTAPRHRARSRTPTSLAAKLDQPSPSPVTPRRNGRQGGGPHSSCSIVTTSPRRRLETAPASSSGTPSSATAWFDVTVTQRAEACVAAATAKVATTAAEAARVRRIIASDPDRYESRASAETERLGAALAARLAAGDVVTVRGELGSGKTTLVRGACRALGVDDAVTSPTFTIGHRYRGRTTDISHLDLFRFRNVSAAEWGDLEPYFDDAIVFVEWPEAGAEALPPPTFDVTIEHAGGDARIITVRDVDPGVRHGD